MVNVFQQMLFTHGSIVFVFQWIIQFCLFPESALKNIIKELKFLDHHVVHTIYWKFYSFTKFEHFPIDLTPFARYHRYHYFNKCSYLGGMFVFVFVGSVTMLSMCVNLVNFCGASSRTAPHLIWGSVIFTC